MDPNENPNEAQNETTYARREFLTKCGKFAVVTPPVVTLMLSNAEESFAMAASPRPGHGHGHHHHKHHHGNNGFGNGGNDGVPGRSRHQDETR